MVRPSRRPGGTIDMTLVDALAAWRGLVCLIGAGGKKSTLYRLAELHWGRVGITATVHTPPFPRTFTGDRVIASDTHLLAAVLQSAKIHAKVAFAQPSSKHHRLAGIPPRQVARIAAAAHFDVTLIKADGARSRWLKAPDAEEPQLPEGPITVIPVVSARALGEPLSPRIAHRMERVVVVTGARPGDIITPKHMARLLADPRGSLQGVGNAVVVPLINMVDDPARAVLARETARRALMLSDRFDRVVLASMQRPDPLVDVIIR